MVKAPNIFSLLSNHFRAITTENAFIYLDYNKRIERFGEKLVASVESKGLFFAGSYQNKLGLGLDEEGNFYYVDTESHLIGTIEEMCGIDSSKAPVEAVTVDIMGKSVPLGLVLSYKLGMTKLLSALKPKYYRTIKTGTHAKLESHEYLIKFNDFSLVLSRKDRICSLIMSGLQKCSDTEKYSIYLMDKKEIYFNLLESLKLPGRYVKEIDLYYQMFVDPITERILIEMREPTDFGGLLIRAVEMLLTRHHADEVDMSDQRIVGYERISGEIYTHLVNAVREHNRHGIKANYPVELNPEAVWMSIAKDTSKQIEECLNPIQDLKQQEVTTFGGNGGRSRQSMVKRTRAHHKNAVGIISEASVDSSDSGNTTYLSSNPRFKSLYGIPDNGGTNEMIKDLTPENILSTNAMMMPCLDTDD